MDFSHNLNIYFYFSKLASDGLDVFLLISPCIFQCKMQGNEIRKKQLFFIFSLSSSIFLNLERKTLSHEMLIIFKVFCFKISFLYFVIQLKFYIVLYYLIILCYMMTIIIIIICIWSLKLALLHSCLCEGQMWFLGLVPFNQLYGRRSPPTFPSVWLTIKRFPTELVDAVKGSFLVKLLNICTYLAMCSPIKCCILNKISILSPSYLWQRLILSSHSDLKLKSCISNVDLPLVVVCSCIIAQCLLVPSC